MNNFMSNSYFHQDKSEPNIQIISIFKEKSVSWSEVKEESSDWAFHLIRQLDSHMADLNLSLLTPVLGADYFSCGIKLSKYYNNYI